MSQGDLQAGNPYASFGGVTVADAPADERASFIKKTYTHLAMAIYAFAALEWFFLTALPLDEWLPSLFVNRWVPLIFFGAFILVSWIAESWAKSSTSIGKQYAGLVTYVVAQAVFFVPLLWFANQMSLELSDGTAIGLIPAAGVITLVMFGGLTAIAWVSGKDFSFLGAGLGIAGFAAFGLILVSALFGFNLGVWFSVAMVVFACAYILYDTSNVMHHYQPGQHVAASLSLFASVALLFWYVIRILMSFASND